MWAPKRLTLIFEWESLFNDWTAVATFSIILSVIYWWWAIITPEIFFIGFFMFIWMIIWWVLFWIVMWYIFSNILWKINYNEEAEISLALISWYVTFVLAEIITHKFSLFHNSDAH